MNSVMQLGCHSLMAKLDEKRAFPLCPVRPSEPHLLGMHWQGQYYFDKVLPFGLRSAPFIFNCLAEGLDWLGHQQGITLIHHCLDDFFIAANPDTNQCSRQLSTITGLCEQLNIPLEEDKHEGPTTLLEYLGIFLDSSALEACGSQWTSYRTSSPPLPGGPSAASAPNRITYPSSAPSVLQPRCCYPLVTLFFVG